MKITTDKIITVPPISDFHCHLRQDKMMEFVTPLIRNGGCDTVYVMPNLQPPITTVAAALEYHSKLSVLEPEVNFLMTLYLHPDLTVDAIARAASTNIIYGVKLYPAGVTTNSQDGVLDIESFFPIFDAMEKHDLVLNIHGEMMSSSSTGVSRESDKESITVMNAEPKFLPQLYKIHEAFPNLRIVLEHVSTREGIEAVRRCGSTVAGTITGHHLWLTIDDVLPNVFNYCKPVAKRPEDRIALICAVLEGTGKFFFGSDSAPHHLEKKVAGHQTAAGCFTHPWSAALVVGALVHAVKQGWISEDEATTSALENFLSKNGRRFYRLPRPSNEKLRVRLEWKGERIPNQLRSEDGNVTIIPFMADKNIHSTQWISDEDK